MESLEPNGYVVLSLDNINKKFLEYGPHQVEVFPNDVQEIISYMNKFNCDIEFVKEIREKDKLIATLVKSIKR